MEGPDPCKMACTDSRRASVGSAPAGGTLPGVSAPFRHRIRVRWAECDMQGIVFYGHYLEYFDLAITELFREALGAWGVMAEHGADLVVGEATLHYRSSARFDDEIDLVVSVARLGNTAMTTELAIERDGELLVEGTLRHVCIDPETMTKQPLPAAIREALVPYTTSEATRDAATALDEGDEAPDGRPVATPEAEPARDAAH